MVQRLGLRLPFDAPRLARQLARQARQHGGLRIAQQRHELGLVGQLRVARGAGARAQQGLGRGAGGIGMAAVAGPYGEQRIQVAQLARQGHGGQRAGRGALRAGQGLGQRGLGAVAFELGLHHVQQLVRGQRGQLRGLGHGAVQQAVQLRRGLQPALHVGAGDAGGAQRHALAVHLLQRTVELAGHGQQARLRLAQAARRALQQQVAVAVADDGGDGVRGAVDELGCAVVALARLAQAELGTAGDGVGKLAVQARQLRLQQLHLAGIHAAQLVGAHHLAQQGGQFAAVGVVVLGRGAGQRRQQAGHALGQRGQVVAALGLVPGEQAHVAQALEHRLQRLGAQRVKEFVDAFARQLRVALRRQLQEHPHAQLHQRRGAVEQAAQCLRERLLARQVPQQRGVLRGIVKTVGVAKEIRDGAHA